VPSTTDRLVSNASRLKTELLLLSYETRRSTDTPGFARGASPAQTIRHHPLGGPQRPEMFSRLCFDIQGPEGYTPSRRRMLSMISGGAFLFDGACLEQ